MRQAHVLSHFYFVEVSSGIYYVKKDRMDKFEQEYISPKHVANMMNSLQPTAIERIDGTVIMNRHLFMKI
jgi:hypothetical protein